MSSRDAIARDQRLVIMVTKRERERYEAAVAGFGYGTLSDLIRDAVERRLLEIGAKGGGKP